MLETIKEIKEETKKSLETICDLAQSVGLCKSATWDCPQCILLSSINQIKTMLDLIQKRDTYNKEYNNK